MTVPTPGWLLLALLGAFALLGAIILTLFIGWPVAPRSRSSSFAK